MAIIISPPIFFWGGVGPDRKLISAQSEKEEEEEEEGAANDGARRGIRGAQENKLKMGGCSRSCSYLLTYRRMFDRHNFFS